MKKTLEDLKPELAREWHPTKNGNLKPSDVLPNSHKKVWWVCKNGHSYNCAISHRNKGIGCPYCSGRYPIKGVNDLATVNPDLAQEWDFTKNGDLTPSDVLPNSEKKVWWICPKGHSYIADIGHRSSGRGCPICDRENKTSFPEQAILYYLSKKFIVESRYKINDYEIDIFIKNLNTGIEYDGIAFHSNENSIEREKRKNDFCKKKNIRLIRIKESKEHNLFVKDDVIFYRFDRGEYKKLSDVLLILFDLLKTKVDFSIDINIDRTKIYSQYLNFEKANSFVSKNPKLLEEWDFAKNGDLNPNFISYGSTKKVWWKCKNGHSYLCSINHRTRGRGCPICAGKVVVPGINDFASAFPELAKEWHPTKNGCYLPMHFTAKSQKIIWWKCSKCGYEWQTTISHRTNGTKCPKCHSKKLK